MSEVQQTIVKFLAAGLSALPAVGGDKRPTLSWKEYQQRRPTVDELQTMPKGNGACIICGAISDNLELLDFDYDAELFDAWSKLVPAELLARLVIERSQNGGKHVVYRNKSAVTGNAKLASGMRPDRETGEIKPHSLIETRGEGGLFVCWPTPNYEMLQGDLCAPPVLTADERDTLIAAANSLNEIRPQPKAEKKLRGDDRRPGDDFNERGDLPWLLQKHGWTVAHEASDGNQHWTRPGKSAGTSATLKERVFYCFSSNATPFEPGQAYAPFSVYALLEHAGDFAAAARALRHESYGQAIVTFTGDDELKADGPEDPGPIPESLLRVPGFVSDVMNYTLATAPYPSVPLAFCGALALQAFLAGRKVMDLQGVRPNIYLLALADSGSGKNAPRTVNVQILNQVGLVGRVGDSFASGQGLEDAMAHEYCMFMQTDEMDGMIRAISQGKDPRFASIMDVLLRMHSSSSSIYPMRKKAGAEAARSIDQPCLILFGTAIPQHFYQALSQSMLTNGLIARMIIVDSVTLRVSQEPKLLDVPKAIVEVAKWWAEHSSGSGNLSWEHPSSVIVEATPEAAAFLSETRKLCDDLYNACHEKGDVAYMTIWARVNENIRKLALLHAVSKNHLLPTIDLAAAEWGSQFAMHQAKRMLFMAAGYVAENPFDEQCLRFKRLLQPRGRVVDRSKILRRMKTDSQTLDKIAETLSERGEVLRNIEHTGGRPRIVYALAT